MKTISLLIGVLCLVVLAGCGSSNAGAKATSTPKPLPTSTAAPTATTAAVTGTVSATGTAAPTAAATVTSTGVIGNIPLWCGNLGSAQSEVNKLNAQMGSNPSVSQLVATLRQLHTLIAADAVKAKGQVRKYFNSLASAASTAADDANKYTGILSSYAKTILKAEVQGIAADWQIIKSYAGCGVIH